MHHTLIAGLGNVLMGDDAIGPTVVAHLSARYVFPDGVKVADLGTPGVDLVLHLAGLRTVVLVDALADLLMAPGTIRLVRMEEILAGPAALGVDPHSAGLREAILLAEQYGGAPPQMCLVGVAVDSCGLGAGMSVDVLAAIRGAVDATVAELRRLDVPFADRVPALPPDLWWAR